MKANRTLFGEGIADWLGIWTTRGKIRDVDNIQTSSIKAKVQVLENLMLYIAVDEDDNDYNINRNNYGL